MGLRPGSQSPDCLVKSHIGSAYDNVKTVADNIDDVIYTADTLQGFENLTQDITEVANNIDDIEAVASNIINVNEVAENTSDLINVSNNMLDVNNVSESITNVNKVSADITSVNTLSTNIDSVLTVEQNLPDIIFANDNITDIQKSKEDMADINTFVESSQDDFIDNTGSTRKTLTGIENVSDLTISTFNSEAAAAILEMNKSRGFRVVGTFADGFTYELFNDVGIDASGKSWIYVGAGAPNKVVDAGTVPSVSAGYEQVTFNDASNIQTNTGTVQGFIDSFELKVFQSPTTSNTTLIESYTKQPNQVFDVRKTSDDTFATIYSDAAGTTEIVQNGTDNKSGSDGAVKFYIADGDYYIEAEGVKSNFTFLVKATGSTTARSLSDRFADVVNVKDFGAVGDGITDDYAAIMAAINSTNFNGMGNPSRPSASTVYFPLGKYYVGQTINLKKSVRLKGEAAASTEAWATVLEFADNCDGIIINGMDSEGAFGNAPRSTTAGGSTLEGLVIRQRGFVKISQLVLDYNPTTTQFVSYNSRTIPVGTDVHGQDDRLTTFFTGKIETSESIQTVPVVPSKYVAGLGVDDVVTGSTSGATARVAYVGHKVLVYLLKDVVGTFEEGETVTGEGGSFKIRTKYNGRTYKIHTISNSSGDLSAGDILAPADSYGTGIVFRTRAQVKDCVVSSFPNFGISIATDGNSVGNSNCSLLQNIFISNIGKHGLLTLGGDSNAGTFTGINVTHCTGYGIKESSFLGNHYFSCHTSANNLGQYYSAAYNNFSVFVGAYSEGGPQTQPFIYSTSRFGRNTTVIGGDHGAGILPSYDIVRPTYLNGDNLNFLNSMYAAKTTTSGLLSDGGVSFRAEQGAKDNISLVCSSQYKIGEGPGIAFRLGAGGRTFKEDNSDTVRAGYLGVEWEKSSNAKLNIDLMRGSDMDVQSLLIVPSPPAGGKASPVPIIKDGKVTELIFGDYGDGYVEPPVITGRGVFAGFEATTTIMDGKVVDYEIVNPLSNLPDTEPQRALTIVSNEILSGADNTMALGSADNRWKDAYLANSVITTSDERKKTRPIVLDDVVLDAWGAVSFVAFQWIDSVMLKGNEARTHIGVIAQQIHSAFENEGLDAFDYGLLCYDTTAEQPEVFDDDGNQVSEYKPATDSWGIRPDQCLFMEAAYQRRENSRIIERLELLEAK